ncbi:hypothetical protein [Brachyspira sp.]|uniref:hypothetical protein n=1 Tax=Brachyspira sp. TaxID=1977261 RepID=UPI003D7D970D
MLRKILLSLILILAVGCGGNSFKNGVYEGFLEGSVEKEPHKYIISKDKIEDISYNTTNYYSKINDKNEDDKDIVYYVSEMEMGEGKIRTYLGIKQTNDNSLVTYPLDTAEFRRDLNNFLLAFSVGLADANSFNAIATIYSIDINNPVIFEKVEE